jgi:DNA-binding CsgD family transcriptional regulator
LAKAWEQAAIGAGSVGATASTAFDRWHLAALVLDASGRVLVLNRRAAELLQHDQGLGLSDEAQLLSFDAAVTEALRRAVQASVSCHTAVDGNGAASGLEGITLPRRSGAPPLWAMVAPLPYLGVAGAAKSFDAAGDSATVLLIILDPGLLMRGTVEQIARQFRLTQAEQRLTEAIVNGASLADAAGQLGIRLSTARNRLKAIQAKTHCRRQVDLVRLVLTPGSSLPAALPACG